MSRIWEAHLAMLNMFLTSSPQPSHQTGAASRRAFWERRPPSTTPSLSSSMPHPLTAPPQFGPISSSSMIYPSSPPEASTRFEIPTPAQEQMPTLTSSPSPGPTAPPCSPIRVQEAPPASPRSTRAPVTSSPTPKPPRRRFAADAVIPSTYPSDPPLSQTAEISPAEGLKAAKRLSQAAIHGSREKIRQSQIQQSQQSQQSHIPQSQQSQQSHIPQSRQSQTQQSQAQSSPVLGSRAPNILSRTKPTSLTHTSKPKEVRPLVDIKDQTSRARDLVARFMAEKGAQRKQTRQRARDEGIHHLFQRYLSQHQQIPDPKSSPPSELKCSGPA
jgi:hypothetical protein